jgi:NAD(P)H-quinone oxidoreductase subunit 5
LLAPLSLAFTGLLPAPPTPGGARAFSRLAIGAAAIALVTALGTAVAVAVRHPLHTRTLGSRGIGAALYLDPLSAVMFCLVAFVGVIVVLYSKNYLEGDPGHVRFTRYLCLTLASILTAIISGNMLLVALAWISTNLCLQRLLLFYPERPAAVLAGRKKFIFSRIAEAGILGATALVYSAFGSLDYAVVFSRASALRGADVPLALHGAAILLVVAALLTSAQFPTHGWLIEVMETPTPVSALLHAGIINAGGFLILRFAGLIALSLPSLDALVVIGGFTALFGSIVMLTQSSIKVTLAYSTVAQMGFMLFECGLGAFPAALLHIVAHSCYKAHAFLSSGSVIDISRASYTPTLEGKPNAGRLVFVIVTVLVAAALVGGFFGSGIAQAPGVFALGATLLLGIVHLLAGGIDQRPNRYVFLRTAATAAGIAALYFGLQSLVDWLLAGSVPPAPARGWVSITLVAIVVAAFAAIVFLQNWVPGRFTSPRWRAVYAHVANGLYVNTLANRLVVRFWPAPAPPPLSPTARPL